MILVLAAYFGMAYYLFERILETAKHFEDLSQNEEESIEEEQYNYRTKKLDMNIDTENVLYKEFMSVVNKNELNKDNEILVCCTGDYQSMALLTIASKIFKKVHVLFYNYDYLDLVHDFLLEVCYENKFHFHTTYNEDDNKMVRYNYIKELCQEKNISYVFEAHTFINNSNQVLANFFAKQVDEPVLTNLYKPFINIDNITLFKFFCTYNIDVDGEFSHLEHTRLQDKTVFEDVECQVSYYYPDWRTNLIEHFNNVDFSTELNIIKGKYGFLLKQDLNKISFISFKKAIKKLFDEYNFNYYDLEEYYMENEEAYYISNDYQSKIDDLKDYLNNIDLNELIQHLIQDLKDNISDCSFEDIENNDDDDDEELKDDDDNDDDTEVSDVSVMTNSECEQLNDETEYILKVDLSNDTPIMEIVNNIDNYHNEYLNGIVYLNICNNEFFIYNPENEKEIHNEINNNDIDNQVNVVCDDKKNQ
jgi:hypothetical protein